MIYVYSVLATLLIAFAVACLSVLIPPLYATVLVIFAGIAFVVEYNLFRDERDGKDV